VISIITSLIVVHAAAVAAVALVDVDMVIVAQLDHGLVPLYRDVNVLVVRESDDHRLAVPSLSALATVAGRRSNSLLW
jgi:hypothetical protein